VIGKPGRPTTGKLCVNIRSGSKTIELAKGKTTVEIVDTIELINTLNDTLGAIADGSRFPETYAGEDVIHSLRILERENSISFNGYSGDDKFFAYGSSQYDDIFFGGDGLDTLIYDGPIRNHTVQASDCI